jgi:hypothetical protein
MESKPRKTTVKEHVARLRRREAHLRDRITKYSGERDISYDLAEASSLRFAIHRIEKCFKFSIDAAELVLAASKSSGGSLPKGEVERLIKGLHFNYDWNSTDAVPEPYETSSEP